MHDFTKFVVYGWILGRSELYFLPLYKLRNPYLVFVPECYGHIRHQATCGVSI